MFVYLHMTRVFNIIVDTPVNAAHKFNIDLSITGLLAGLSFIILPRQSQWLYLEKDLSR